jgi:hypothetical protein
MSQKALAAFRHMLENSDEIKEIFASGDEYYFKFKGHIFSIARREADGRVIFSGFVYPGAGGSTRGLAEYYDQGGGDDVPLVRYGSDQPENVTFTPVLKALHRVLADKHLNLDGIFDDVLKG